MEMLKISKAIIKKDDKYLVMLRSMSSIGFPGHWDFPGGKDDPGETPAQSVVRETMEETGYEIDPGPMIHEDEYHDEQYDLQFYYFTPKILSGELRLSSEHSEPWWATKDELKGKDLHPSVELFLNFDL